MEERGLTTCLIPWERKEHCINLSPSCRIRTLGTTNLSVRGDQFVSVMADQDNPKNHILILTNNPPPPGSG